MDEIKELKERVEKLEKEQQALRHEVLKLSTLLLEGQTKRRQKPQIIVGPAEIRPAKPRHGDINCSDERQLG